MKISKVVRLSSEQNEMLEILKKELSISQNAVFILALIKLYKELIK